MARKNVNVTVYQLLEYNKQASQFKNTFIEIILRRKINDFYAANGDDIRKYLKVSNEILNEFFVIENDRVKMEEIKTEIPNTDPVPVLTWWEKNILRKTVPVPEKKYKTEQKPVMNEGKTMADFEVRMKEFNDQVISIEA